MSRQPLEYRQPSEDLRDRIIDDFLAVRRFRRIVLVIAIAANSALLSASLYALFPRGRPGMHNLFAMLVGMVLSPIVNGVLVALSLGFESALYTNRKGRGWLLVAPVTGAIINLVVLLIVS